MTIEKEKEISGKEGVAKGTEVRDGKRSFDQQIMQRRNFNEGKKKKKEESALGDGRRATFIASRDRNWEKWQRPRSVEGRIVEGTESLLAKRFIKKIGRLGHKPAEKGQRAGKKRGRMNRERLKKNKGNEVST